MNDEYESVADDILKAQTKLAKHKATEIWKDFCDEKIPIALNDIVQKLGIYAKSDALTSEGMTRTDAGITCIIYNANSPTVRQRFTVAHEIGHIVLEHTSIFGDCSQFSKKSQESEANSFARELLVPSSDLKQFVKSKKCSIQDIVQRYWVSQDVAFIATQNNKLLNKIKTI